MEFRSIAQLKLRPTDMTWSTTQYAVALTRAQ
jgi:hypothetical protein